MSDPIDHDRRRLLGAGAMVIAGARLGLYERVVQPGMLAVDDPLAKDELASLRTATAWLNSPALTAAELKGKVVLIDIWTYTCINWLRHAALCSRVGREVPRSRSGRHRRACSRVPVRARP